MTNLLVRLGLSVVLIGLAFYDWKHQKVPNVVVMPLMLATLPLTALRLATGEVAMEQVTLIGVTWAIGFFMQATRMLGGGDAKLAMALVGLFPEWMMVYMLLVILMIGHVLILLSRDGWSGIQRVRGMVLSIVIAGQLPIQKEIWTALLARRRPVVHLLSLAGLLYLWLWL